ncbi:BRO family protein [Flavobacterium sp. ZS1P70]|uniref:BRO family protein n=1 Tax=Flavobacterium zhoui TaxID=3230414 RepID=A0ABW6I805_9FLAO
MKLFESKQIRSQWDEKEQEWFFVVVDILIDSSDPKDYWYRMKKREKLSGYELSTVCRQLKIEATDGKKDSTDCANKQDPLRIIQSIPSPKAEPFKQWLVQVGAERIAEIENPELAQARVRATYKAKGYSDEWIEKRNRGILVRDELTNEWKQRGVKEGKEYSILTAEISKATFGVIPSG